MITSKETEGVLDEQMNLEETGGEVEKWPPVVQGEMQVNIKQGRRWGD